MSLVRTVTEIYSAGRELYFVTFEMFRAAVKVTCVVLYLRCHNMRAAILIKKRAMSFFRAEVGE